MLQESTSKINSFSFAIMYIFLESKVIDVE